MSNRHQIEIDTEISSHGTNEGDQIYIVGHISQQNFVIRVPILSLVYTIMYDIILEYESNTNDTD